MTGTIAHSGWSRVQLHFSPRTFSIGMMGLRVFCDMHIHSHYSRATSEMMNFQEISRYAALKGLNIVGTGDSTHPKWVEEIKEKLEQEEKGFMRLRGSEGDLKFILSCEVSTIYSKGGSSKRIHHVLLLPDIDCMEQVNDLLSNFGDMSSDGRPILNCSSAELVEFVSEVSSWIETFPAHAWTPHFSLFGLHGFNSIQECYEDCAKKIHALETGLSSDPPMNWRLSSLDKYVLVSNSDSHSPWPWRLGREANLFDLKELSYRELVLALRRESESKILCTIETHPEYGKYHWSGHRSCGVRFSPEESKANGDICPRCSKRLTKGVEQRVNELADREKGFRPCGASGYVHLLPLSEVIATVLGFEQVNSAKVWKIYSTLVRECGSEFSVMLDAEPEKIERLSDRKLAAVIMKFREDRVIVEPGYDGVYGRMRIDGDLSTF